MYEFVLEGMKIPQYPSSTPAPGYIFYAIKYTRRRGRFEFGEKAGKIKKNHFLGENSRIVVYCGVKLFIKLLLFFFFFLSSLWSIP